ncbi:hypothetical protein NEMBOFW57_010670 [Staphylotrichum longicolle]|uniref:Exo-1,4-beta-D-glucosaminidase n=1 Tax=Staphylotrichum longicolle TaxID=669026 RepID=A0AAD4ENF3_9PEZI|nr:hypothetical protein NEMBOFW57_010670 [Staphylotrichum longicolle]
MRLKKTAVVLGLATEFQGVKAAALVVSAGDTAAIPSWDLQSSAQTGTDLETLSRIGLNTSSWHHVVASKCTLMGCLIEAGVYSEDELFYSENLRNVDAKQFLVPWIYRNEFELEPLPGQHYFLQTHGISSRADIYLNGKQVASSAEQAGSYVGRSYEITGMVNQTNALVIQAHPTDYYRNLALGWVDWNPWPADNGTGVWRDVEIRQTGPVMLEPLRVMTQNSSPIGTGPANVTLKARAHNLENSTVAVTATGIIAPVSGGIPTTWNVAFTLPPLSTTDIVLNTTIQNPVTWWPRQWGSQPLYNATLTITPTSPDNSNNNTQSDHATTTFGFRTITTTLNAHNDTTFHINGRPFQVLGAGYSPNLFLRFSPSRWESELRYALSLGLNTIRLEGKNEHPLLYSIADRLGVMLLPGWECCDKWEAWAYNTDLAVQPTPVWGEGDYEIAERSMSHEAGMMQAHPSVMGFLVGSDYWPDERATAGPNKSLFHLSREGSQFETREIYNAALWKRWGPPTGLEDYLMKSQLMDYEATRAQVEAYTAKWNAKRPATGLIYWMLNNAWPGLHWNLWDYYMRPAGSYFGAMIGGRVENAVFDPVKKSVWLVNRSLRSVGVRNIDVQVLGLNGTVLHNSRVTATTNINRSREVASLAKALGTIGNVVFLRLILSDGYGKVLSRNVYWVAKELDVLDWDNSEWYVTPVTRYADYTALNKLDQAQVAISTAITADGQVVVTLENQSAVPAFFVSLNLVDTQGKDVLPLTCDDNYVTLWPKEKITLTATKVGAGDWEPLEVRVVGKNVEKAAVSVVVLVTKYVDFSQLRYQYVSDLYPNPSFLGTMKFSLSTVFVAALGTHPALADYAVVMTKCALSCHSYNAWVDAFGNYGSFNADEGCRNNPGPPEIHLWDDLAGAQVELPTSESRDF